MLVGIVCASAGYGSGTDCDIGSDTGSYGNIDVDSSDGGGGDSGGSGGGDGGDGGTV